MKTNKFSFILSLFTMLSMTHGAFCEPVPVGPITFSQGLDILHTPDTINDEASPDMCNCVPTLQGAATKRNGSKRYISQAISSFPVTSLFKAYASTTGAVSKSLIATNRDKIIISTDDVNPQWVVISSNNALSQHYSHAVMNRKVLIAGDGQSENVMSYDILNSTIGQIFVADGSSNTANVRPKYHLVVKNYYIAYNVVYSTSNDMLVNISTKAGSRLMYSLLNNPSSMTLTRFIDFRTEDGEEGTGVGLMNDRVDFFKPSSIGELVWTNALNLLSQGGDWVFSEVVSGFGCIAPRTLANMGFFYVFLAKDGIRIWDGGRRQILDTTQGSQIISWKIKPIIDALIKSGNYKSAVGQYYPKKQWYLFSYEDPNKFPKGKNNSTLVYDFITGEWYPFCNWLVDSYAVDGNITGQLYYGDSSDGYVHLADLDTQTDDSRKEIVLDVMDSTFSWVGSTQDVINVKEGTASIKLAIGNPSILNAVTESSITNVNVFQMGEWYDRTKASKDDKISFKAFATNLSSISYLRMDLEVNLGTSSFDLNYTSVTFSSAAFTEGNNNWTTFEFSLSSFPLQTPWTDLGSDLIPFSNTPTYYGIRFVLGGVNISSVSIDDLRFVQNTQNPVRMFRSTKLFNMQTQAYKGFGSMILTKGKYADSNFKVDIYNDFGQITRSFVVPPDIPKEIFVTGFSSSIVAMNSIDFTITRQTTAPENVWSAFNGIAGRKYLYIYDRTNDREMQLNRSSFTVTFSTYGSFGSGTTNFNLVSQQGIDDNNIFLNDMNNQRIKEHRQTDLSFFQTVGSLGTGTTSFNEPSGLCVNNSNIIISEDGNARLTQLSKSTLGVILQVPVDYNTLANSSLQNDERFVYHAYNKVSEISSSRQDLILEKRDIGNLSILNRVRITPSDNINVSTSILMGEIALLGKYIYIPFTDSLVETGANYYIQKRLRSDFSLVTEYKTKSTIYSVIGDGLPYKPFIATEKYDLESGGKYIQLKFYDDANDNGYTLFNMTFLVTPTPQTQ